MAVYVVSLLVLVVASILCMNTCQHGQAVILDFKEQINDIRLRRAPGQSLRTSGNANHQQLMMPSVEDIGTQLKRIGREATESKQLLGSLATAFLTLLGTFVVMLVTVLKIDWAMGGKTDFLNCRVVGMVYLLPHLVLALAGFNSVLTTNAMYAAMPIFTVALAHDSGFEFLTIADRNALVSFSSHMPVCEAFGFALTGKNIMSVFYPAFLALYALHVI